MKNHKIGCLVWLALFLTVLFSALKLTGCISWAWIWVASPAWMWLLEFSFGEGLIAAADAINAFTNRHKGGEDK